MNRVVLGIACGVLIGAAVGRYVHPTGASMFGSFTTAAGAACPIAMDGKHRLENTRAALARSLTQLAKDPAAASGRIEDMPGLMDLVRMMARQAPVETARMVMSAGLYEPLESEALSAIALAWFERDGASIIATLVKENAYDELKRFYRPVFAVAATERPFEALGPIMALEDRQLRNSLFVSLCYGIDADELPRLAHALMTLPVRDRQWIVRNVGSEFAQKNPEFALAWAASLTPAEAAELQSWALRSIAQSDPTRALALAGEGTRDRSAIEIGALEALAHTDPMSAIAIFDKTDDVNEKRSMASYIARGWGASDGAAAAQWVASLSDTNIDVAEALQSVANNWAHDDIDAAAAFTNKLDMRYRNSWIISVTQGFMYEDTEKYLQWIEQFRAEPWYPLLLTQEVWPMERDNPEAAISYVLALDPAIRNEPLQKLIEQVSDYDPKRAAGWLSQISDDHMRFASMDRLVAFWSSRSPNDLAEWIDSLPPGAFRDSALATLVAHSGSPDLKSLSSRIESRDSRVQALFSRGVQPEVAREIVAILHDISLDERQWKALESALASAS